MLRTILDTVFNGLLISTSGYAMFALHPVEHPFAFAASALGFCHGCTGLYTRLMDSQDEESKCKFMNTVKKITTSCMEFTSTALINIDLYANSKQTSALALGHGLFIVPLAFDLVFKFTGNEEDEEGLDTGYLRDLTALGNIVSLLFYAANEHNIPAGIMTLAAFLSYSGSMVMENIMTGTEENTCLAGYSLFFGLLPLAVTASSDGIDAIVNIIN